MVSKPLIINLIAVGLLFTYTLMLARVLNPQDLGSYGVILSTSLLLSVITTLKCEIFLIKEQEEISELSRKYIAPITCIMASFLFIGYYMYTMNLINSLLCVGLILSTNLYDYKNYDSLRNGNVYSVAKMRLKKSILLFFIGVGAVFDVSLTFILIGEIIARAVPAYPVNLSVKLQKYHYTLVEAISLIKSCALLSVSWFINNAFILSLPALITLIYDAKTAGIFFLTYKILSAFEAIFANTVNQYFIAYYRINKNTDRVMKTFFYINLSSSIIFGFIILLSYNGLGYLIIPIESLDFTMAVCASLLSISQCFSASIYVSFNLLNKEFSQFLYDFFRITLLIMISFVCLNYNINIYIFLALVGVVNVLSSSLLAATMLKVVEK